ncbi:hypothetical protein Agub_g2918 [Astrephomene gubernaculifera]|uniref:Uncharacterized protein n=1 Tax=Astrephomene gubernaculifera TaxID=47775 RepID=A0AAD3DII7_9CHLO|nr:hypothetical protein Agub_g2918 [Astrephomene gubernaculifera]
MTGRRAVGSILHRAARGAGLDRAGASLEACRGAYAAVGPSSDDSCGATTACSSRAAPTAAAVQQPLRLPYNSSTAVRPIQAALSSCSSFHLASSVRLSSTFASAAATTHDASASNTIPAPSSSAAPSPDPFSSSLPSEQQQQQQDQADPFLQQLDQADPQQQQRQQELLSRRGPLVDALSSCLGLQQLDALLSQEENREAMDEMLLLTALDTAHRLCTSAAAASSSASARVYGSGPAGVPLSSLALSSSFSAVHKPTAEAASDVLTRLSELLIQLLSEPGALSAEGAVRALRTLAVLRFNPAGDYAGLQTMASFYREAVLPSLDPASAPPEVAVRAPQLLIDLYYAFSRLFEVAARRERELQAQLAAEAAAEEDAACRRADDDEASGAAAAAAAAGTASTTSPPWMRGSAAGAGAGVAAVGEAGAGAGYPLSTALTVVGDRQLYYEVSRMLAAPGVLANMPTKSLGSLSTAMATARFAHYPLAQSVATQTVLRLQQAAAAAAGLGGAAAAAAAGLLLPDGVPAGNDAMATSTLSNIVSCLAKLGFEHEALCDATANWMLQRLYVSGMGNNHHHNHHHQGQSHMALVTPMQRGFGVAGGVGGVQPHHIVDVAVAFARVKYDNMDFLLRAAEVLQLKLNHSAPNSVAMMTWAIANTKSGHSPEFEPLLNALSQRMVALYKAGRHSTKTSSASSAASSSSESHNAEDASSSSSSPDGTASNANPNGSNPRPSSSSGEGGLGGMAVVPRHLACMAFAMARMGRQQPLLMDTVAADVAARADKYSARQLCNILRAFTMLDSYRPHTFAAAAAVLTERLAATAATPAALLAAAPPAAPYVFGPQNYSDAAWAVALSGHASQVPELMELLRSRVAETAPQMGKACLVRVAQAFAVAGGDNTRVFDAIEQASRPLLVDLGPAYLAALVDAFAEVQHPVSGEFWTACMDAVGLKFPHLERPRPDMQAAAARLAAAFRRHPASAAHPACAGHYVLPLLESLAPQQQ